jgi:acyl-CoA synthetase (AMP-forming)/AMP-acid ligase II
MVLYGASPISAEVVRKVLAAFGCDLLQFYGMTETSGTSLLRPELHDPVNRPELLASAGTDSVSYQTRVVDENDVDVPPHVIGEIISRSPGNTVGYWNNTEATRAALRGGWMHTGDLGYFDENGYLFVADRLKDMVVSGGENVYPREVEDVIYEHPDVYEVAVIGVPDDKWGERVHAVVTPRPGADPSAESVIEHCRQRLAGYKVPKTVEFLAELPKNPTGKILKRVLRDEYWEHHNRNVG